MGGAATMGAVAAGAGMKKDPTQIYGYSKTAGEGLSQVTGYIPTAAETNRAANGLAPGSNASYKYGLEGSFQLVDSTGKASTISARDLINAQNERLVAAGSPKKMNGGPGFYQAIMGNYVPTPGYVAPSSTTAEAPAAPASTQAAEQATVKPATQPTVTTITPAVTPVEQAKAAQALITGTDKKKKPTTPTMITGSNGLLTQTGGTSKTLFGQ